MIGKLALAWLIPAVALAQYTGFSAYPAMNKRFPCGRFLEVSRYADKPIMAVLYSTFGNNTSCIKKFVHKFRNRSHALEFHLNNETCRRGGRVCFEQELFAKKSPRAYSATLEQMPTQVRNRIQKRVKRILEVSESANGNTRLLLSLGLEDQYTDKAASQMFLAVKEIWPYEIIRNPVGDRSRDRNADVIELHAVENIFPADRLCIWNQDGLEGGLVEAQRLFKIYRQCLGRLAWTIESQGITTPFTPPLKRAFVITKRDVKNYGTLLRNAAPAD